MSIDALLAELKNIEENTIVWGPDGYQAISMCVEAISKHMAGMVLVPVELIQNIGQLDEAGFGVEEEIGQLLELITASQGDEK